MNDLVTQYVAHPDNANKTLRNLMGKSMNDITRGEEISKDQALYLLSGGVLERTSVANVLGCSVNNNANKTLRNLMGKSMNDITRGEEISKDQALYLLSGGVLERTSVANVLGCSVNTISVDELGEAELDEQAGEDGAQPNSRRNSFTWTNVCARYKKRPAHMAKTNLYRFVSQHWNPKAETVPMFFGYPRHLTSNVIPQDFMKFTLAIYKPWKDSFDEHYDDVLGSYDTAFYEFLHDADEEGMPGDIRADVLRALRRDRFFRFGAFSSKCRRHSHGRTRQRGQRTGCGCCR